MPHPAARKAVPQLIALKAVPQLIALVEAGRKFKAFVHAYLTQHGVALDDLENEHSKAGCRIGRLPVQVRPRVETAQSGCAPGRVSAL